ncbi:TPA: tail assembly chaperone [Streptococcus pyogenes]|uniref:Phage protein n=1 Tax=Streptococcus pyogenes TaxID=1314 RepID=A0A8B6IZV6_STRPY|nr:tail assembly chaperone [Streptococcus pyogenes]VGQ77003.1 phage protein [Streptococcus pyogenes]VGT52099.1 phage protein [Streptococcus pyogenes]VGX93899.1 phage protein [Streptococcus pyogenes]VHA84643.1 phage protein [Streptococcus pyogenes]VHB24035.1 phage protein [Streptococcus pyogenes]
MQLEIKGKNHNVKFGTRFVAEMDKAHVTEREGMKFGTGLQSTVPFLFERNVVTLAEIIHVGTITESPRPSLNDIYDYIDEVEDIEKLFNDVLDELRQSNASKLFIAKLDKNMAEMEAEA